MTGHVLTDHEYHLLHHVIGAPKHAALCVDPWRNYGYVGEDPACRDALLCETLVAAGLMESWRTGYYRATPAGIAAVAARLPVWRRWCVTTSEGDDYVYAASRSKARADVIRLMQDGWEVSWREALRHIRSVRLA